MRNDAEIRKHRDNLRVCADAPCGCPGAVHEKQCIIGGHMMRAAANALDWCLGSNDLDMAVERVSAAAAQIRMGNHGTGA